MKRTFEVELSTARRLALAAGAAAMRFYGTASRTAKADASPVTEADHASNRVIVEGLRAAFPGTAILSEESRDTGDRLDAERVWIVDPLDGTKEFLAQNGEFSVMIGLAEAGEAVLGVVYLPAADVLFWAARGLGARVLSDATRSGIEAGIEAGYDARDDARDDARGDAGGDAGRDKGIELGAASRSRSLERRPADLSNLRLVGSRSHHEPLLEAMQRALGISDVEPCGSVGVKCSRIAEGRRDLYVHPVPYLKEWDTCAPEVVLREAGGDVTDCRGEPLRYNKPDPRQPHGIVAVAPGALDRVLQTVRRLYERGRDVA